MKRIKRPTVKQKLAMYEGLLHDLHFCSTVVMNHERLRELLSNISDWSYAHRVGNGEPTEREQAQMVDAKFWKLRDRR